MHMGVRTSMMITEEKQCYNQSQSSANQNYELKQWKTSKKLTLLHRLYLLEACLPATDVINQPGNDPAAA